MGLDFSDDVTSSIALLHCLDETYSGVESWFNKNLQLETRTPSMEQVEMIIGSDVLLKSVYFQDCLECYRVAIGVDARGSVPDAPIGLDSHLDGKYWR